MKYFIETAGASDGPFNIDDLRGKISKNTLVWHEGLEDWKKAEEILELKVLFTTTPPPLPQKEKTIKVEALIKKDTKKLISNTSERKIATELKYLFYILLFSVGVSLVVFLVKKTTSDSGKYSQLIADFKAYDNDAESYNTSLQLDNDHINKFMKWLDDNRARKDKLLSTSKEYYCYSEKNNMSGYVIPDDDGIVDCLQYKIEEINSNSFSLAKKWFIITLLVTIAGRYIFFASKWVSNKSAV